jgi:S-(hydroxymethyl)glutathione dehydrogenase/alcohol dehydrogenase
MAERVVLTPGRMSGDLIAQAMALTGKGGTCVVTGMGSIQDDDVKLNLFELSMWNKEIKGSIFGSLNPRADIPRLLNLYREGQLKLDELITKRYKLEDINEGYRAMRDGENIRGVIIND